MAKQSKRAAADMTAIGDIEDRGRSMERGRTKERNEPPKTRNQRTKIRVTKDSEDEQDNQIERHDSFTETEPFPDFNDFEAEIFRKSPPTYVMRIGTPDCVPGQGDRPFTRGVIEPLLHDKTAAHLQRAHMKARRGTGARFRDNMTTGSPKVGGVLLASGATAPVHQAFMQSSGVPLTTMSESAARDAYINNMSNRSSPSILSGDNNHSSKASSNGNSSVIAKFSRDDQVRMSSEFSGFSMHMSESSHENIHLRAARDLVSDSTVSSNGVSYGPPQYTPPVYGPTSRPSTAGSQGYMSAPTNNRPVGGYSTHSTANGQNIWAANSTPFANNTGYSGGGFGYVAPTPALYGTHPYNMQEPTMMYRAQTYPVNQPRAPAGPQRIATYPGPALFGYGDGAAQSYGYQQPPYSAVGSRLNANAAEFSQRPGSAGQPFNPSHLGKHVFIHPAQQINWRHLLEPGVTADWDMIVDKIISSNDQQASIFLQQKIKNSEPALKDAIIDSIINRGLELMGNRFGNFLIQRVFECANHAQTMGLASHIEGHTVRLSTDAFGCHVIQKAFDCVPESFKHQMVRELLTRIRDTIVHRYACHVWQKLFELRWQGPPPMIMGTVNAALVGQWTQVAIGETGSLVVQNIFENCNEDDKRPCINEVLANLDFIARGQYGNWCIQHVCEHGEADDREAAINMILARAADYSMDQYASKCIEKCLKVCGSDFLDRYLQQVLMRGPGETFSPLVQIARDQYGNFLIQWILNNASPHLAEIVKAEIRKHLVSLRGNKYGSKVALTCGYGPQGVRPGVPFAPAGHRNSHNRGPHGPPPLQNMPVANHTPSYAAQYQYAQLDGGATPQYQAATNYMPMPPRHYSAPYGGHIQY